MISSNFTQRSWQGFLALCLCLFTLQAFAASEAAVVLFSHGVVTKVNGSERLPLAKGDQLAAGDTVNTGEDGRVQMRFTDGGLVSLMPNSSFAIDRYNQPDTQDGGSLSFRLMKGGLRTITGSIGQKNHDNYELKTDVATLGIRGTEFVVVIDGDAMRVQVNEGLISLQNQLGDLMVPAGQNAVVFPQQAPTLSDTAPLFISSTATNGGGSTTQTTAASSPTDSSPIASTSQTNDSLAQSLPAQTMLSPAEYTKLEAHLLGGDTADGFSYVALGSNGINGISFTQQQLDSLGLSYTAAVNQYVGLFTEDAQTIGNLTWGSYTDNSGFYPETYYAFWGTPATNLPVIGTLNYNLSHALPTSDSNVALNNFDLAITLNGTAASFNVDISFTRNGDSYMNLSKSGLSGDWGVNGPATFKIEPITGGSSDRCMDYCSLDISGFLTGPQGSQAATAFTANDYGMTINGAAILDKTP